MGQGTVLWTFDSARYEIGAFRVYVNARLWSNCAHEILRSDGFTGAPAAQIVTERTGFMRTNAPIYWNAYPALLLALGLACGVVGAARIEGGSMMLWMLVGCSGGSLALGALVWESKQLVSMAPLARTAGLGLLAIGAGGAAHEHYQHVPSGHVLQVAGALGVIGEDVMIAGHVTSAPQRDATGLRFSVEAERLVHTTDTLRVLGQVRAGLWRSAYADSATVLPKVHEGDRIRVQGRLEPVPGRRNPADFDYGAYLERRGIYGVLNTYDATAVDIVGHRRDWRTSAVVRVRAYIRTAIQRWILSARSRAVLQALLLGDRSGIGDATRDRFARTGLMHLLAVSGLHVLLVGMVLYRLLRSVLLRLGLRWRATEILRAAVTMAVLVVFMLITGSRPSVVRAVIMAGLFIGGAVLQRTAVSLNTLGVAAIVLLVARPPALFDAGFQLSFSAVGAIVIIVPRLTAAWPEAWNRLPLVSEAGELVAATAAATVGTAPVLLYHFGGVPLAGLLLNVIAIPVTFLLMAAGLAMAAVGALIPHAAEVFGAAAHLLAHVLLGVADEGDRILSWSYVRVPGRPPWVLFAGMLFGLIGILQWSRPRLRWKWIIAAMGVAALGVWMRAGGGGNPNVDVIFFDVGHGDAALVTLPNDKHILIDAGPRSPYSDAGRRTLLPHLRWAGISRLEMVVLTHADGDHIGGLPAVLRSVPVRRIVHNGRTSDTNLFREVQHVADSLSIPYAAVEAGDTLHVDSSVRLQVLAPIPGFGGSGDNNVSVVVRLVYGKTCFLFTGDVEAETEAVLVQQFGSMMASDVVKVPHHGSSTSSTPPFVTRVTRPDTSSRAVVSVSRHGRFGLPDPSVIRRWNAYTDSVWVTGTGGAAWFRSDGSKVRFVEWQ